MKSKKRHGVSKSLARKRAQKNRYHRSAKVSEYTTLSILRGFAEDRSVRELGEVMRPSEKTLRDIYRRLRLKLMTATVARPLDFGGAGFFMFRKGRFNYTGRQFLAVVRESDIYASHRARHAPRLSDPKEETHLLFEVSVRVFCNIALDKSIDGLYPPQTLDAIKTLHEIGAWIDSNRDIIAAHETHHEVVDRFEAIGSRMAALLEMEKLLALKTKSAEHHFPSTVLYDHLRRYLLTDPM